MTSAALAERIKRALDRVDVFGDSEEVAFGVRSLHQERAGFNYWPKEAAQHILGQHELIQELSRLLRLAVQRSSAADAGRL